MRIDQFISSDIVDRIADVIILIGFDGAVLDVNQTALDCYGYSREELLSLNVRDLRAPLHQDDVSDQIKEAIERGVRFETEHRRSNGEAFPVEVRSAPVVFDGESALLSFVSDITERRMAADALADTSSRMQSILEGANVGTWEWNVQSGETAYNETWARIVGYTLEELAPVSIETWHKLAHPEDVEHSNQLLARHFAGELPYYDCECRLRHKDGSWVWVHDRGRVFSRAADGEPLMMFGTHADITERKRTETSLVESEEKLSILFDSVPDAVVVTNLDSGEVMEANEGFFRIVGRPREQVLGATIRDLSLWMDIDDRARFVEQLRADGEVTDLSATLQRRGCEVFPALITATLVDIRGQQCTLSILRDVTEAKRAEEALRESEERFATIFHSSPVSISLSRLADGLVIDVNEAYLELFELKRDQVIGRVADDLGIWADPADRQRMVQELAEHGRASSARVEFKTGKGEIKRVLGAGELVTIAGEACVLAFAQDIGDLVRAQEAMREREAQYRAVVETAPDGFWILDTAGHVLEINDAYARRSGYSRDELLGMNLADLEAQESPRDIASHFTGVIKGGTELFETKHRAKDGTIWDVEVSASYWPIQDGRFFGFIRDITSRKRVESLVRIRAELADIEHSVDVEQLLRIAIDKLELMTGSSVGFFHLLNPDEDHLHLQVWSTRALEEMSSEDQKETLYLRDAGPWADCLRDGVPVVSNESENREGRVGFLEGHPRIARQLMAPIRVGGKNVAIVGLGNEARDYTEADVESVVTIGAMVANVALRRQTQQEFERFFELVPDLTCIVSMNGRFHRANPHWKQLVGYDPEELVGTNFLDYVHPEDLEDALEQRAMAREDFVPLRGFVSRFLAKDGSYHWLEWNAARMDQHHALAAARDITERKETEAWLEHYQSRLRALAVELAASGERERARLGIELHDGLGQVLTAAKMAAQSLAADAAEPSMRLQARRLVDLLSESIAEVRQMTSELASTVLFDLGLGSALLWLRDRYAQLYGLTVAIRIDQTSTKLRGDKATFVFRVAREALNNVVRHSKVLRATVTVRCDDGWHVVIVSDRGVGFDDALIDSPGEGRGFGLFSIREECLSLGGTLEVTTKPGHGTRIRVRLPV